MSEMLPERPTFTSGQYIGAADLNATVDYARDETRRLALSARTWGIATGLALVEVLDAMGNVQIFIEPGIAWDGYGRPVVVLSPAPVTLDLFAGVSATNPTVWLRYNAAGTQAIAPGFQTCGAGDPTTRVLETYAIEAGPETVQQQTDGVIIGGATVADPRDMLIAVDTNASVVLDGSAAHQTFPDDTGRWLIPVGIVNYIVGSPGKFSQRDNTQLALNRATRRYMGLAAESLLAADGVLRLRDRQTDNPTGLTDTQLDQSAAIKSTDIGPDPNNPTRLIGNELVWVEGNMRITGNARMFGTQLELRDPSGKNGAQDVAPEFLRSAAPGTNPLFLGGQDLQICIGSTAGTAGADRLTIGVLTKPVNAISSTAPDGPLNELMVVRTDGRVAIGTNAIDSYSTLANNLVVASPADTGITLVSDSSKTGNLYFVDSVGQNAQGQNIPPDGYVTYDHVLQQLELGAGAQTVLAVTPSAVVIGGVDFPTADKDQLIVASSSEGAGITISGKSGTIDSIDFADGTKTFDAGFIRYNLSSNQMSFGTNNATPQMCIDNAGRVGIGTQVPGNLDADANQLVVASSAGAAGITIAPPSGTAGRINFADGVGTPHAGFLRYDQQNSRMEIGTSSASTARVVVDANGNLGVGTLTPIERVHITDDILATLMLDGKSSSILKFASNGTLQSFISTDPNAGSINLWNAHATQPAWLAAGSTMGIGSAAIPRATLDVRGPGNAANAANLSSYVAIVENCSGASPSNVLALVVDTTAPNCEFITFFDNTGLSVGSVELTIGTPNKVVFVAGPASSDFAEAVPRQPGEAAIAAGSIVGVRHGLVSLATEGADRLFVATDRPAVLGNAPPKDKRGGHEMLSFLGQVPVLVSGPVNSGDLIVASGKADGGGCGVPADKIQPTDLARIVGQAWASATPDPKDPDAPQRVNALVGPGVATAVATGALLERQARRSEALAQQIEAQALQIETQARKIERLATLLARRKPPA